MKKIIILVITFASFLLSFGENVNIEKRAEVYFSLTDDCSSVIAGKIDKAKKYVYFASYSLTEKYIGAALIRAKKRGIEVIGITEKSNANGRGAIYRELRQSGIEVYLDGNSALMHHKFAVIDDDTVITGSFNWTAAANKKNNENLNVFYGKEIAAVYLKEFKKVLWDAKYKK